MNTVVRRKYHYLQKWSSPRNITFINKVYLQINENTEHSIEKNEQKT